MIDFLIWYAHGVVGFIAIAWSCRIIWNAPSNVVTVGEVFMGAVLSLLGVITFLGGVVLLSGAVWRRFELSSKIRRLLSVPVWRRK